MKDTQAKPDEKRRKVAIVGKAPASIPRTPFGDESYEIWSLSDNYRQIPRWDRWFELHDIDWHREQHPEHWEFLTTNHEKPLYLLQSHKDVPHATLFPLDFVCEAFCPGNRYRYFTNSVSYMIALAMLEEFTTIGIYGVDMAQYDEYAQQRPSCEYWIGQAVARGITVDIPEESDLMKCRQLYGYDTHNGEMYRKLRARDRELADRMTIVEQELQAATQQMHIAAGGLGLLNDLSAQFNGEVAPKLIEKRMQAEGHYRVLSQAVKEREQHLWHLRGAREDLEWTRQWC